MGEPKNKNVWNYILIVVVVLGIFVGYLSYLQDKKMDKMEQELDRKKDDLIKKQFPKTNYFDYGNHKNIFANLSIKLNFSAKTISPLTLIDILILNAPAAKTSIDSISSETS